MNTALSTACQIGTVTRSCCWLVWSLRLNVSADYYYKLFAYSAAPCKRCIYAI